MFGGFGGVLPIRLGGSSELGWTAPQHARVCADVTGAGRTMPLASLTLQSSGVDGATVLRYRGRNGVGLGNAPSCTRISAGTVRITWETTYPTETFQSGEPIVAPWGIRTAIVSGHYSNAPVLATISTLGPGNIMGPSVVQIEIRKWTGSAWALSDDLETVSLRVFGDWGPDARIGDYDGAPDKEDSTREGDSSYFYDWFLEIRNMRGSAYSTAPGNVDAENFALARQFGALYRAAEKLENNSMPGTSDEKLEYWVNVQGISTQPTDQRWQVRQRCAGKMRAAAAEESPDAIDDAIRELLGDTLVAIHRTTGSSLSSPPPGTRWPGVNPGTDDYSLGGGAWFSERSFLWVEVVQPVSVTDTEFFRLMNVELFELLDLRLPAHMTFNWATSDGFLVGISQLGFAAL